jgi:uncharacterized protein (DUF1499 family)
MTESAPATSRVATIVGVVAALAFTLGPLTAFLGILKPLTGFSIFGLGGLLGVVTLLIALITAARKGLQAAGPGLLLGGIVTVVFVLLAVPSRNVPRINDITTDTEQPPAFVHAPSLPGNEGRDMSYPGESFASQQKAGYPDLKPLELQDPPPVVFDRIVQIAAAMPGWEVSRTDSSTFTVEGVSTSRLFRFQDDFVIQIRPLDGRSVVHMRSKSRDGRGDVGANAARIEAFFAKLR